MADLTPMEQLDASCARFREVNERHLASIRKQRALLADIACQSQLMLDTHDANPLDTARRAASKLNRHQRRELMVHLMEIENG